MLEVYRFSTDILHTNIDYRDIHARDPEDRPPNATVGLVPAILSNRISHFLNIKVGFSSTLRSKKDLVNKKKGTKHDD
jgi:hypothetical protein